MSTDTLDRIESVIEAAEEKYRAARKVKSVPNGVVWLAAYDLGAADMRERAAKVCEDYATECDAKTVDVFMIGRCTEAADEIAARIRALKTP
jgi:hypothetical protein